MKKKLLKIKKGFKEKINLMKNMIIFTDKTQNSMVRWCGEGGKGGWKPKILTLTNVLLNLDPDEPGSLEPIYSKVNKQKKLQGKIVFCQSFYKGRRTKKFILSGRTIKVRVCTPPPLWSLVVHEVSVIFFLW